MVRRRGSTLVYVGITIFALLGFCSLAVDLGRVYVVRSEMQLAADASARYAVTGLSAGPSTVEAYAVDAANDNKADGTPVNIIASSDVEFGDWNAAARSFTVVTGAARSTANAVRVTARRTSENGDGVPLLFAKVVGISSFDVKASSIAWMEQRTPTGIIGFNAITMQNNTLIAAYNSATNTNPTAATSTSIGNLTSNGTISGGNNNELKGGIVLGPSAANPNGITASGGTTRMSTAVTVPAQAAWAPQPNPNGVPQAYTVSGTTTLPPGDYWFTSLTVSGTLTFSGPAVLVVNGPVNISGAIRAYNLIPANLTIKQRGNNVFGDPSANGIDIVADIQAPGSDFVAKNNLKFRGRMIVRSIEVKNNAEIYYDSALGESTGGTMRVLTVR